MPVTTYTYSIAADFPGGAANSGRLDLEIRASSIVTALEGITVSGDVIDVVFKDALASGDKTTLDGDTTGPAGGLIAAHDSSVLPDDAQSVEFSDTQPVVFKPKSIGTGRLIQFSHDFTKRETWYSHGTRVVGEAVGTGDGVQTVFSLANPWVIDVTHGKITDELNLVPFTGQGGSDYICRVYLDAVEKTERGFTKVSGGDWEIDHETGDITFFTAPASGVAVTADYFYSPNTVDRSTHCLRPPTGKKWIVTIIEAQFSKDVVMTDAINSSVWTYDPGQGAPPARFQYPGSHLIYKRFTDAVNFTWGSLPVIPAMGGAARGVVNDIIQLRAEYVSPIELSDAFGAELRIWLTEDIPYTGEGCSFAYYGYEDDS